MVDDTKYVRYVRHVIGMVTERWEKQEDAAGYNKSWEIYFEAAEEIANLAFRIGADPNQVPTLVREYFFTLASDVRSDMTIRSVKCATARKSVADRARRQALQTKDIVKVEAYHAAACLLEKAGDVWVTAPSATLSAVYIGGDTLWNEVVGKAQAAATAAFVNRAQPGEISDLFGGFFNRFMVVVRTRRKVERLSWGATKMSVAELMLRGYISTDPVRAAAYTTAALMLEAVPSGDIAESPISPPACSEPRRTVAPAAAPAATAAAELAPSKGSNAPSASVNTLSTPATATTPISGARDTIASMTKGCGSNLFTDSTLPDHAATSPPLSRQNSGNNNNSNTTTTASTAMMPPPTGINRTRWAKQRYSHSGSVNDPTRTESTNAGDLPRSMDTVGAGSSSSGPYDVREGASIAPGAAPAMAVEAVGVEVGVTASPAPLGADQGTGALGPSNSGQHTSEHAPQPEAEDGIEWYGMMDILVPTAPEAATSEVLDVDRSIYMPSLDALGPGNSESLGMAPHVPVASEAASASAVAAAVTPSPVIAGAGVGGAGATMAAPPDTASQPNVLVAAAAEAAASGPLVEASNTGTSKKRKATGDEGTSENPPCDGGARKKARSE